MKIPLIASAVSENNQQLLNIWRNGENEIIKAPLLPYFYSTRNLTIDSVSKEKVKKIALSDGKEKVFYKYSFNTISDLVKARVRDFTFEDKIPFIFRIRIDHPEFFTSYAHTNDLNFNFLDIEQYCPSEKTFPDRNDRLISIAFTQKNRNIRVIYLDKNVLSDKLLLEEFIKRYPQPDVQVVYNLKYDIPMIIDRCHENNLSADFLSKTTREPHIKDDKRRFKIHTDGMVIYDIYQDSTKEDTILTGNVSSRGLKDVSDFFDFKSTAEVLPGDKISEYIGTKTLKEYNREDVKRLSYLFDIYWPSIEQIANDLQIPLKNAIGLNNFNLAHIILGDLYRKHGIIADGSNFERFPDVFRGKYKSVYEGGLNFTKLNGLQAPVYKADYSSLYPNIIRCFNLSPDTTKIIKFLPYEKNGFKIVENKDDFVYYIPDRMLNNIVVFQVLKKEGFLAKVMKDFLEERKQYKEEYAKTKDVKTFARSNIAKLKANALYGILGMAGHPFGYVPISIATSGIGRECLQLLCDALEELFPESVIDASTDGIYYTTKHQDVKKVLDLFTKKISVKFGRELDLSVDFDNYDAGYFYKNKCYILKDNERIIFTGTVFKSKARNKIYRDFVSELGYAVLNKEDLNGIYKRYCRKIRNLEFPLSSFVNKVSLGKNINEYNSKTVGYQIAVQAYENFDPPVEPIKGKEYSYVETKDGHVYYPIVIRDKLKSQLNVKYYLKEIDKVAKIFRIEI